MNIFVTDHFVVLAMMRRRSYRNVSVRQAIFILEIVKVIVPPAVKMRIILGDE